MVHLSAAYESAYTWLSELPGDQFMEGVTQELHCHRETGQGEEADHTQTLLFG